MPCILYVPASPAVVPALAPRDPAGLLIRQAVVRALKDIGASTARISFTPRPEEYTRHTGRFTAWGDPRTDVRAGNYLPELVARYLLGLGGVEVSDDAELTVVPFDGSLGLTPRAPKALLPGAREEHEAQIAEFSTDGWHLLLADDTLGVGRFVAWREVPA